MATTLIYAEPAPISDVPAMSTPPQTRPDTTTRLQSRSKLSATLKERKSRRVPTIEKLVAALAVPHRSKSPTNITYPPTPSTPSPLSPDGPRKKTGLRAMCKRNSSGDSSLPSGSSTTLSDSSTVGESSSAGSSKHSLDLTLNADPDTRELPLTAGDATAQTVRSRVQGSTRADSTATISGSDSSSVELQVAVKRRVELSNDFLVLVAVALAVSQVALLLRLKGVCPLS